VDLFFISLEGWTEVTLQTGGLSLLHPN